MFRKPRCSKWAHHSHYTHHHRRLSYAGNNRKKTFWFQWGTSLLTHCLDSVVVQGDLYIVWPALKSFSYIHSQPKIPISPNVCFYLIAVIQYVIIITVMFVTLSILTSFACIFLYYFYVGTEPKSHVPFSQKRL